MMQLGMLQRGELVTPWRSSGGFTNSSAIVASTVGPEHVKLMLGRPALSPIIFRMHLAGMLAIGAPVTALPLVVAESRRSVVAADTTAAYRTAATKNTRVPMACNIHSMAVCY
jgi:hypothetical protein